MIHAGVVTGIFLPRARGREDLLQLVVGLGHESRSPAARRGMGHARVADETDARGGSSVRITADPSGRGAHAHADFNHTTMTCAY